MKNSKTINLIEALSTLNRLSIVYAVVTVVLDSYNKEPTNYYMFLLLAFLCSLEMFLLDRKRTISFRKPYEPPTESDTKQKIAQEIISHMEKHYSKYYVLYPDSIDEDSQQYKEHLLKSSGFLDAVTCANNYLYLLKVKSK